MSLSRMKRRRRSTVCELETKFLCSSPLVIPVPLTSLSISSLFVSTDSVSLYLTWKQESEDALICFLSRRTCSHTHTHPCSPSLCLCLTATSPWNTHNSNYTSAQSISLFHPPSTSAPRCLVKKSACVCVTEWGQRWACVCEGTVSEERCRLPGRLCFVDVLLKKKKMKNHSWEQRNDLPPGGDTTKGTREEEQEKKERVLRRAQAGYGPKWSAVNDFNGADVEYLKGCYVPLSFKMKLFYSCFFCL